MLDRVVGSWGRAEATVFQSGLTWEPIDHIFATLRVTYRISGFCESLGLGGAQNWPPGGSPGLPASPQR